MNDVKFFRFVVFINGLVPLVMLGWDAWYGQLGANAVNDAIHVTGILSLVFLFLSLAVTPLKVMFGWSSLIAYRRSLGLFGFFYALVHLAIYFGFDRGLDLRSAIEEISSRRYLQVGALAICLMVPLAATSTNAMVRKLGAKRWKLLHRLAYAVAILGVVHFYLLVKSDVRLPLTFAAVLTPLLGFRLGSHYWSLVAASRKPKPARMASIAQRPPKYWKGQLRVASTIPETHNVKTFRLQSPDGADLPFRFEAGQYINLRLPINGQFVSRSYTISSAPTQSAYCEITVKREEQGTGSRYLHDQVREGAILEVGAPAGRFTFDHRAHHSVTLIAGGVGITPMMSIARSLIDRSWAGKIYFIFVARTPADLIFHDELRLRDKQFRNLNLLITLTSPPTDHWPGQSGRLNAQVLQSFVPDLATHPVFVCGPAAMMEATCELLKQMGVPDHLIRTEEFVSPPASQVESNGQATPDNSYGPEANGGQGDRPDDLNQSIIHFVTSRVVATADPQTNLLEVAESAGVDLPWECRAGICGQCKIKCLEGKVSMASHLALSESEKTSGYILACQALPVSSEIRVQA